jgi:hypothetical protein
MLDLARQDRARLLIVLEFEHQAAMQQRQPDDDHARQREQREVRNQSGADRGPAIGRFDESPPGHQRRQQNSEQPGSLAANQGRHQHRGKKGGQRQQRSEQPEQPPGQRRQRHTRHGKSNRARRGHLLAPEQKTTP